jgi:two-component system OmpR family response regulator
VIHCLLVDDDLDIRLAVQACLERYGMAVRTAEDGAGMRRAEAAGSLAFDGWRFDRLRRELLSPRGVVVALSAAELRLLSAFTAHAGRVLTREQLIELTRVPGVEANARSVDLGVSRLRQKLGDTPLESRLIRTMRGEDYLFDTQVQP